MDLDIEDDFLRLQIESRQTHVKPNWIHRYSQIKIWKRQVLLYIGIGNWRLWCSCSFSHCWWCRKTPSCCYGWVLSMMANVKSHLLAFLVFFCLEQFSTCFNTHWEACNLVDWCRSTLAISTHVHQLIN
jgi:hypothetical protein